MFLESCGQTEISVALMFVVTESLGKSGFGDLFFFRTF